MGLELVDAYGSTRGQRYAIDHPTDGDCIKPPTGICRENRPLVCPPWASSWSTSTGARVANAMRLTTLPAHAKKSPREAGINVQHTS